jgi:hypothetical protein
LVRGDETDDCEVGLLNAFGSKVDCIAGHAGGVEGIAYDAADLALVTISS